MVVGSLPVSLFERKGTAMSSVSAGLEKAEDLVAYHRVAGRILDSGAASRELQNVAARAAQVDRSAVSAVERVLAELGRKSEEPLLQLKGTSVFESTGRDPRFLRRMSDIDLAYSLPAVDALRSIGYRKHSDGICHERGIYRRRGSPDVELHEYIPSWDGSQAGRGFYQLPLGRLWADATESSITGVMIPSLHSCAAILAATIYRDSIELPIARLARVRVGDILDLLQIREECDRGQFSTLLDEISGHAAVNFVDEVARVLTDDADQENAGRMEVEIARGISVYLQAKSKLLLNSHAIVSQVLNGEPGRWSWDGHPLQCNDLSRVQIGNIDEIGQTEVYRRGDSITVAMPMPSVASYKSEIRFTTINGVAVVQHDQRSDRIAAWARGGGGGLRRLDIDDEEVRVTFELHQGDRAHVGTSRLTHEFGSSWARFYAGLASESLLV